MLNRKLIAALLAAAIVLCGISAFAADPVKGEGSGQAEDTGAVPTETGTGTRPDTVEPPVSQDIPREESTLSGSGESGGENAADGASNAAADPAGTVSFANLADRVRAGNLNYLFLQENISVIDVIDYEKLQEEMRDGLNDIANAQWQLMTSGSQISTGMPGMEGLDSALQGIAAMSTSSAAQSLQAQYDSLREKYDDLKEGKTQKDAADSVRQLQDAQNSILMVTESIYIQLMEGQAGLQAMDRALAALDRQIREKELRYQMGQISALTLQQLKGGRTSLVSQRQSLENSLETGILNLESMIGGSLTGKTQLTALPKVSDQELSAMDLEADLAAAKEASYTLYDAKKTLDNAEQDYKDAGKEYNYNEKKYQYLQAKHTWQAAQYTYENAVQSFELSFRSLYAQVKDYKQVLDAARTSLAVEESKCAANQLKYEQGAISQNALLTAQDDVKTARDTVSTAERNLFSAYNNYRWAVEHGILN